MTKPPIAQLRAIGHSGFGFLSSLVIGHSSFNGYTPRLMMSEFDEELAARLGAIREQGLYRELPRIHSPQ